MRSPFLASSRRCRSSVRTPGIRVGRAGTPRSKRGIRTGPSPPRPLVAAARPPPPPPQAPAGHGGRREISPSDFLVATEKRHTHVHYSLPCMRYWGVDVVGRCIDTHPLLFKKSAYPVPRQFCPELCEHTHTHTHTHTPRNEYSGA